MYFGVRALEIRHAPIAVFELRHLLAQRIALRDDVLQTRTEFSLQALEERQALLDLLKPRRGRVDVVGIAAQEEREVFQLCLDPVACVEVRAEPRIERRKIRNPAPHAAQLREDGPVAFVQRRVALGAEPFDALRAGEHLPCRGEFLVLAGSERRAIELRQLEGRQFLARTAFGRPPRDAVQLLRR